MSTVEATHGKVEPKGAGGASPMSTVGRLLGAVGTVLVVSTPLTYILTDAWGALVWGKLFLGLLLIGAYLATNADVFGRMAGARSTGLLAVSSGTVVVVLGLVVVVNYLTIKNPK